MFLETFNFSINNEQFSPIQSCNICFFYNDLGGGGKLDARLTPPKAQYSRINPLTNNCKHKLTAKLATFRLTADKTSSR